ncbi:bifunctional metallophosphatase/5'-nucleotidase [Deinococcus planocerae]|uniref:bifunctional metallophosphatase/5'-nucleotidase n=1 Tax=Deinococcus planocerae TaxID=1737569 RepID=UPI000C7F4FC2|nr:bifunctional UDP-sugar hydrolase/5'-nucleotidase [Deinococcus planocerae]
MPRLTFLHTNDIHGHLPELARLTALAHRERARAEAEGRTVYRWDAGDAFDRRFEAGRLTRGAALPPVLAASGVTLQTVGNDIGLVYGMGALTRMAQRAPYPMLAANLRDGEGPLVEGLRESVLLDGPDGLKIGVFGLTAPWDGLYGIYGLHLPDEREVAARLRDELWAAGAQVVILLSHLGLEDDRQLAAAVPGLDLIIGAHSHDLLPEGEWVGGTLIVQAGDRAKYLGRVDLDLGPDGKVSRATATVLPVPEDTPPDDYVERALEELERELEGVRHEVVGHLTAPLPLNHFHDSALANFAAEALRTRAGAEIGLVASGTLHAPLDAGPVTRGALVNTAGLVPVNPLVSAVTGRALLGALERSLDPAVIGVRHHGMRGTPIGLLGLSGLHVQVDDGADVRQRVREVWVGGAALDPERTYRVAHTDLETEPGTFLSGAGVSGTQADASLLLEDVLREHLASFSPVSPPASAPWAGVEHLGLEEQTSRS